MLSAAIQRRWVSNVKMTKQLKKMIERRSGPKKKKVFPGQLNHAVTQDTDLNPRRRPTYTEGQKRRAHQVGRVLYDNIVHLVNSGAISPQLGSLCVEIVRVNVVPDFSSVNVYWLSSGTEKDSVVERLLTENAGQLRHLLSSQHIIGTIPRISFVRDDSQARFLEVESLLAKADFGPDFVPTQLDTSIRESILRTGKEERVSPEEKLQTNFDKLSIGYGSVHPAERWTGAGSEQGDTEKDTRNSNNGKVDQSGSSHGVGAAAISSSTTLDSFLGASQPSQTRLHGPQFNQPSSMDVGQLCSQFLSGGGGKDVTRDPANLSMKDKIDISNSFRDNIYKVPHSELMKKIQVRKQRASTRPKVGGQTHTLEMFSPTVPQSSTFKLPLQKKQKVKRRLEKHSDFFRLDGVERSDTMDDYCNWDDDDDDEFDEELSKSDSEYYGDNLTDKK